MNAPMIASRPASQWFRAIPSLGVDLMDLLFNRLDGAYPNVWRANFKTPDSIANWRECWADAFDDEGLTPDDVKAGLKACRRLYDMPPSLTQFVKACRPGITDDAEAMFHRAVAEMTKRRAGREQDWPSAGLFWAAASVGGDLLSVGKYSEIRGRWVAALDAHGRRTDPIPQTPAGELPAPKLSAAEAAVRLQELGVAGAQLGKSGGQGSGGVRLEWAEKIGEEVASGRYGGGLQGCRMAAIALRDSRRPVPASLVAFLPEAA